MTCFESMTCFSKGQLISKIKNTIQFSFHATCLFTRLIAAFTNPAHTHMILLIFLELRAAFNASFLWAFHFLDHRKGHHASSIPRTFSSYQALHRSHDLSHPPSPLCLVIIGKFIVAIFRLVRKNIFINLIRAWILVHNGDKDIFGFANNKIKIDKYPREEVESVPSPRSEYDDSQRIVRENYMRPAFLFEMDISVLWWNSRLGCGRLCVLICRINRHNSSETHSEGAFGLV